MALRTPSGSASVDPPKPWQRGAGKSDSLAPGHRLPCTPERPLLCIPLPSPGPATKDAEFNAAVTRREQAPTPDHPLVDRVGPRF